MKLSIKLATLSVCLFVLAGSTYAQCTTPFASQPSPPGGDEVLIDDSLPSGATVSTGSVTWDTSQYATGSQSFVHNGSGTNTVRIDDLSQFYKFGTGKAVLYVLIDPCSTTREIKVTYYSADRTVQVYWGEKLIGTGTQFYRGALPSTGTWTRLEIPISSPLGLQGHVVTSLQIETYDGRVWFDHIGTDGVGCTPSTASAPSIPSGDTVWFDDTLPGTSYASFGDWSTSQKASGTQSLVYPYYGQSPIGVVRVNDLSQATSSGDNFIVYVMPTGCATLNELKITWYTTPYTSPQLSGSVYWGTTGIGGEGSAVFMGSTVPTSDVWTRIEIPASLVGLDGATIWSIKVENKGSQVWVDYVGNATP